jgi:hypothetical protein
MLRYWRKTTRKDATQRSAAQPPLHFSRQGGERYPLPFAKNGQTGHFLPQICDLKDKDGVYIKKFPYLCRCKLKGNNQLFKTKKLCR